MGHKSIEFGVIAIYNGYILIFYISATLQHEGVSKLQAKRVLSILATVLFASLLLSTSVGAAESTKVMNVPRVPDGLIVIDAEKDDLYSHAEEQQLVEQNFEYFPMSPGNTNGVFYTLYDSNYIYLYVDVTDPDIDYSHATPEETWNRESIGVILDFSYIREEAYEYSYANSGDLICYINLSGDGTMVTYHMYATDADTGLYDKIKFATVADTGNGHILYELAMPIPEQVDVSEGLKFGFEITACNAELGSRVGVVTWSPEGSEMWHYTDVCGTAIFGAAVVVETPEPETEAEPKTAAEAPVETVDTPPSPATGNITIAISIIAAASASTLAYFAAKKKSSK